MNAFNTDLATQNREKIVQFITALYSLKRKFPAALPQEVQ